jgi:hypothetical protein
MMWWRLIKGITGLITFWIKSYLTNRTSEKPWDVVRLIIKQISYLVGLLELLKRNHILELSLYLFFSLVV